MLVNLSSCSCLLSWSNTINQIPAEKIHHSLPSFQENHSLKITCWLYSAVLGKIFILSPVHFAHFIFINGKIMYTRAFLLWTTKVMTFSHWIGSKRIDKRVEKLKFLQREERIILVTTQNFRELKFLIFCSLCMGQQYECMKSEKNVPL